MDLKELKEHLNNGRHEQVRDYLNIDIKAQALVEVELEERRKQVEAYKIKLREKKPFFPWRIKLIRID